MNDRVLISGTNSGCGKTTVTLAILAALKARGAATASFKCGPDYIDPMYHKRVLGIPSYNLDPFFCSGEKLRQLLCSRGGDISVIEGVMGYYDGVGVSGEYSTYTVAEETATPTVLVINAKGMYSSAGAIISGFSQYRENSGIKGVVFNGVSPMVYKGLAEIAENEGVKPLGFLPYDDSVSVGSRHLGLITADEITDLQSRLKKLGELAERYVDIDGILSLAASAGCLEWGGQNLSAVGKVKIAVARDEAFCFIYEENLEMLKALGCDLEFFSPIHDGHLPAKINGLYIPGGYPELYLDKLSENKEMLCSVKAAVLSGMPTIAECGGFMYLHREVDGTPLVGVIDGCAFKTGRLQRFGYVTLTAKKDNLLCHGGEHINAHEFHYYDSECCGSDFHGEKPSGTKSWDCAVTSESMYAGFPHLYFPANPEFAKSFVKKAAKYDNSGLKNSVDAGGGKC